MSMCAHRLQRGFEFLSETLEMGPLSELEAHKTLDALRGKR